jgi:hypothetical protein
MEHEGSTPCSQEPSTGPYPEPYQSNPLHPNLSNSNHAETASVGSKLYCVLFSSRDI